jgi:hypothetical protein
VSEVHGHQKAITHANARRGRVSGLVAWQPWQSRSPLSIAPLRWKTYWHLVARCVALESAGLSALKASRISSLPHNERAKGQESDGYRTM